MTRGPRTRDLMAEKARGDDPLDPLDRALDAALGRVPSDEALVVLVSGGVDSGLLAWELRGRSPLVLATFGLPGSADPVAARRAAVLLHLPFYEQRATPKDVLTMRERLIEWVGPLSATEASIETAMALAIQTAPTGLLVCGQGADELFFGYAHYRGLPFRSAEARAESDLARLRDVAWPRTQRVARELGRRIVAPYLDPEFVDAARAISSAERFRSDPVKALFRSWARRRGVPEEIALRPKKALQYGSGVDRLLKKASRRP